MGIESTPSDVEETMSSSAGPDSSAGESMKVNASSTGDMENDPVSDNLLGHVKFANPRS